VLKAPPSYLSVRISKTWCGISLTVQMNNDPVYISFSRFITFLSLNSGGYHMYLNQGCGFETHRVLYDNFL
jgi:hypothetical protein